VSNTVKHGALDNTSLNHAVVSVKLPLADVDVLLLEP
jgi:hypothetical protein